MIPNKIFVHLLMTISFFSGGCLKIQQKSKGEESSPQVVSASPSPVEISEESRDFEFDESFELNEQVRGKIPFIMEEREGRVWYVLRGYDRVFFRERIQITTLDSHLLIEAKEMHFTKTQIQTFPEGAQADVGADGKSGGQIVLRADVAHGDLTVEMRGVHGGLGLPGRAPDENLRGRNGVSGLLPSMTLATHACGDDLFCMGLKKVYTCSTPIPNGGDAENGLKGYPGGNGGRGGHTGKFQFEVSNSANLEVVMIQEPGLGGEPGQGGAGGLPGQPGTAWIPDGQTQNCGQPRDGSPGQQGLRGESGVVGVSGRSQVSCYPKSGKMTCLN